jgi:serine/threonine protein kinase
MAPEQCGTGEVGSAADVFGLAATLHHAVTGRVPFPREDGARDSPDAAVRFPQVVRDPEPLPRRTPAELAGALHAGLARDPADRPTAAELASALEPLVDRVPRRLLLGRR